MFAQGRHLWLSTKIFQKGLAGSSFIGRTIMTAVKEELRAGEQATDF